MKINKKLLHTLFVLFFIFTLTSCASNRSVLIVTPENPLSSTFLHKSAVIRSITDARQFMEKPPTPNIPSLGQGGVSKHSTELRSRAIGRKRNGYGKALGDVFLEDNNSVQNLVINTLTNVLNNYGYEIHDINSTYPPDTIFIDITVNKFWSWIDIGFWSIGIEAEIDTDVSITYNDNKTISISARTSNRVMAATDSAWKETIDLVLQNYKKNAVEELKFLATHK